MIHKAMIRLFPSAVILFITLILCACGNSEPEPGVYEEKKSFEYKLYFLEMNEEGRFAIEDVLCRARQDGYVLSGTYYLYESELILTGDKEGIDIKLVFTADGDNWVYNQKESEGIDVLNMKVEDQTAWKPCEVFFHFK